MGGNSGLLTPSGVLWCTNAENTILQLSLQMAASHQVSINFSG